MDRPEIYSGEGTRTYDYLTGEQLILIALGQLFQDLAGGTNTAVAGFAATPTSPASLVINLAAGDIYQSAVVDATAYGSLPSNSKVVMQQGIAAAQTVTLSTSGLSAGQSRWALIEAAFSQTDEIPSDDPNGGVLPYFNTSNPGGPPYSGPNNSGESQDTRRLGTVTIQVVYGSPASTGAEVPPTPTSGYVPLYLIDLAYGQTAITLSEIQVAGSAATPNVPATYPAAPFISIPTVLTYAGSPQGKVAGIQSAPGISPPTFCWDTTDGILWVCTLTGNASAAQWGAIGEGNVEHTINSTTSAVTGTNYVSSTACTIDIPLSTGLTKNFSFNAFAEGGAITLTPNSADSINGGTAGASLVVPSGGRAAVITDAAGNIYVYVAVSGPASSVSGNVPKFGDTSGKTLVDSGVALSSLETQFSGSTSIALPGATSATGTVGASGTITLPGGLIRNWAYIQLEDTTPTATVTTWTFPTPFPNACLAFRATNFAVAGGQSYLYAGAGIAQVQSLPSKTSINISCNNTNISGTQAIFYVEAEGN